jgi:hypothetical protein
LLAFTVAAALVAAASCGDNGAVTLETPLDAALFADQQNVGASIGQPCDQLHFCRAGLVCREGTCAASHSSGDGTRCTISAECTDGLYCGPSRTCTPAGKGKDGDACRSDGDCVSGQRCNLVGFSAQCRPEGTADVGGACTTSADCFGGLACASKVCAPLPPSNGGSPLGLPSWKGVDCAEETGPTQAYFRVPRGKDDGDFFRLPFPNDVRRKDGHPSLGGFPSPGADLLGFDVVDRYLRDVERTATGFTTYPTITMRFSGEFDFDSLRAEGALHWVEFDASGVGTPVGFAWGATTGRSAYVCPNSLSARPYPGEPLQPGHTYAFIVTTKAVDAKKQPIAIAPDLAALLDPAVPTDPALAAVHPSYKVLRDYAPTVGGASKIVNATVFTVGDPTAGPKKLMAAVAAAPVPTATGWIKCGAGVASPCPQASGDRACGAPNAAFDELHALVTLPIFQKGTAPYVTPDQGGDIATDDTGAALVQRTEAVCLALTVPKGTAPASGWPLVIYAHGTGGSFRSHVLEGVAGALAAAKDDTGAAVPMAVLGIDQVSHGPRRGGSNESPNNLFFNFANPLAARGNPLQGAADQAALARFVAKAGIPPEVTGSAITFGKVAFWGHSQGATEGAIALPYTAGIGGAVLSGEGASLIDALLSKRSPVNIVDVVPFVLVDTGVTANHPALSIFQNAIDPADPLNHAVALAAKPVTGIGAKHVFQPYGFSDSYSPTTTEQAFAIAAQLGVVVSPPNVLDPDELGARVPVPIPGTSNMVDQGKPITAFVRQYVPNGYDGHFVAFREPSAQKDVAVFLADVVSGKVPQVGQP